MTQGSSPVGLVIIGASGRMGRSLLRLLPQFPQLRLHAALVGTSSASLGRDSGEVAGIAATRIPLSSELEPALEGAGLALDFSTAAAAPRQLELCAAARIPLLLGTTGLGPELAELLTRASKRIPLLLAANTSLGAAVLQALVGHAAAALGASFDIQIQDIHHRDKADSPSGTALALGKVAKEARSLPSAVGYASLRGGDVVGEHEVQFLGEGERLRLGHVATDRSVFARGALQAGLWLVRQIPGSYHMADIFKEK
jgi:4-hydroxy-tetrahydrodipicolinate reductase